MEQSRRELNKINCRKRILKASRKLFSTKGYEATMVEDIAQKAEVSKATVYNYFPNKESLLMGIADEVLVRARGLVTNDLANCASGQEQLRRTLMEFVQASVDYLSLSRRITYLSSFEENELFATRREMVGLLRNLAAKAQAEGFFRPEASPDEIADAAMGIYFIAQFQWPHVNELPPEELEEKLCRLFYTMLSAYIV